MTFFPTFRKPFLLFLPSYSKKVQFFLSKKKNVNIIFCRVPFSYLEKKPIKTKGFSLPADKASSVVVSKNHKNNDVTQRRPLDPKRHYWQSFASTQVYALEHQVCVQSEVIHPHLPRLTACL